MRVGFNVPLSLDFDEFLKMLIGKDDAGDAVELIGRMLGNSYMRKEIYEMFRRIFDEIKSES